METAAVLPDDLLAGVFIRLPARSLAASRGTCKVWRDLIDNRQLLVPLRRLLPHSVRGLFINYQDYDRCHFLSRPTPSKPEADGSRRIDGKFDFIRREHPYSWYEVADHCNGLVLFVENEGEVLYVCNPATRWSARLPPCPAGAAIYYYDTFHWGSRAFLVFDPFVSREYKVLLSPVEPEKKQMAKDDACRLMEWPPSAWTTWHEFSSSTGKWEEKEFVREGEAAGTAGDLLLYENHWGVEPPCRYAAYWKGALYIHWRGEFVTRVSLLDDKYRVIKSPVELAECNSDGVRSFLGRSENGVYIAAMASKGLVAILRVWTLSESGGGMEWVPKNQSNLKIHTWSWSLDNNEFDELKYWILDRNPQYWKFDLDAGRKNQDISPVEQNVCWDSDDDNIVDVSGDTEEFLPYVKFLGFHPYKEVIFLCSDGYAVAFHLNSPKVQYLGTLDLGEYNRGIRESFVYTPYLIRDHLQL